MAGTDKSTLIFFDKIFSAESLSHMREREAWPLLGIRTKENAPADAIDKIYQELQVYTEAHPNPHFQFYKREDIPERYHYKSTERIAPIVMIPDVGYAIIETKDYDISSGKDFRPRGIHGYDNLAYEMRAIFMAKGPKVNYPPGTVVKPFFNTEIYQFLSNLLDLEAAPNNATLDGIFF
jgi:predicted AlkP superfamily pyrophosphatase or phosphodiesterase